MNVDQNKFEETATDTLDRQLKSIMAVVKDEAQNLRRVQ
jgi:hypothetical protein